MNVKERFLLALNKNEGTRRKGIHVSSISYDCMRKAYYGITKGESYNLNTLLTFWIGKQIHKTPILAESEIEGEWQGIIGSADEYEAGKDGGTIIEKKSCTKIPSKPYSHHVKQAEYYAVLLNSMQKPVKEAYILYIDIQSKAFRDFAIKMRPISVIEKEMLAKKQILQVALGDRVPPARNIGWQCSYCSFANTCFRE
jgi:CRISPR/Cas system-associated exonuclease Cas4 (RecB family)